jgi:hypothetical protein
MGSIVEVLHAFPNTMIGAEHHQSAHHESHQPSTSRRNTLSRAPRSDTSSSSASTIRPIHSDDTPMTDVMPAPSQASRPPVPMRHTFSHSTRELAYHGSQASIRANPSPALKTSPSVQPSPVTAHSQPPSASSRTSVASSVQNSPIRSAITQSPRSHMSPPSPPRIKVKSLSHIQSFVIDDANPLASSRTSSRLSLLAGGRDISPQYEISEMPVAEIIEMVAGLLTKITTTNDRQQDFLHANPLPDGDGMNMQASSVMAFHGKNVPSISILSYLSRIHKYCPTTYEVFLSLLVYFDRMTERVNSGPMKSIRQANQESLARHLATQSGQQSPAQEPPLPGATEHQFLSQQVATPPPSGSSGRPQIPMGASPHNMPPSPPNPMDPSENSDPTNLSHFFVVDSFNIHRLVIAGVTCASKFFSDIFYTNSRYAKVRVTLCPFRHKVLG